MKCSLCEDCGWVCESHPARPWEGEHACTAVPPAGPIRGATCRRRAKCPGCRRDSTKRTHDISGRGWKRPFDDPIPLPRGRQAVTLENAARYIQKLSKTEQNLDEWQAAVEAMLMVVENNGPTMMARIGVMRALNRHVVREFDTSRKDTHWGRDE
jgi:hypothetical protein